MCCVTRERTEGGFIVRRYMNDRLQAERGPGYSLGDPKISESEYRSASLLASSPDDTSFAEVISQAEFLRSFNGGRR